MSSANPRHEFVSSELPGESVRPMVMGSRGAVSTGHYLASVAGQRMFDLGGTAIDAGIAAGLCLNVLLFTRADFGGVAPIILHHADTSRTVTLDGVGVWPERTDVGYLREAGTGASEGLFRAVTPGAPDAWLTALAEFGTLSLGDVLEPAWLLAEKGAPVSTGVAMNLRFWEEHVRERYPTTYAAFYPEGRPLRAGEIMVRPELARVLKSLMDTEAAARARGVERSDAIRKARDVIYLGWVAEAIADFFERNGGWIRMSDLGGHSVEIAAPAHTTYRGYEVHSCGVWCQGPALLESLNILETFDLRQLGHNSPQYLHVLIEAIDRAYSDRERFFGDPRAVQVPLEGLLSKEYAARRAATIDLTCATGEMPAPGDPWQFDSDVATSPDTYCVDIHQYERKLDMLGDQPQSDTSHCAAIDARGNVFAATPSDPSVWAPVVPTLGFACSGRGVQSRLEASHPACAGPGRRPRLTPNPAIIAVAGIPVIGLGCPGGDVQPQGMLQVFLNLCEFDMSLQHAIEAPRVMSWNYPNSFAPHPYYPGRADIESRVPANVRDAVREMGHVGVDTDGYSPSASSVHAVAIDLRSRVVAAGADPRVEGAAIAW